MDETRYLTSMMERELEGIKENLVKGFYADHDAYVGVLGEAKILIKMIAEARKLMGKREDESSDADDD